MPRSATSAVDKALDLVETIAQADRPLRLSEVAEAVGLHRATAYRVLLDLVRRGWVLRTDEHYLPGAAVLRLSRSAFSHSLVALCHPVLEELAGQTGMMVNLQILESDRARVIDVVRPPRLEMISHLHGESLPVHRFAGPLALVASLEPGARAAYLAPAEADGYPLADLAAELEQVQRNGFALERGRHDRLIASMSRAVTSAKGVPLCALTIVGPSTEFAEPLLSHLQDHLSSAVLRLESLFRSAP